MAVGLARRGVASAPAEWVPSPTGKHTFLELRDLSTRQKQSAEKKTRCPLGLSTRSADADRRAAGSPARGRRGRPGGGLTDGIRFPKL